MTLTLIGDGIRDRELLSKGCKWGVYDCCENGSLSLLGNAQCDTINLNQGCGWDEFD